jgi:hypothetical protein
MKKRFVFFMFLLIALQFLIVNNTAIKQHQESKTVQHTQINKHEENGNLIFEIPSLINLSFENESFIQETTSIQASLSIKNFHTSFSIFLQCVEKKISSTFNQYASNFLTILINNRKSDIIFPFHYHW